MSIKKTSLGEFIPQKTDKQNIPNAEIQQSGNAVITKSGDSTINNKEKGKWGNEEMGHLTIRIPKRYRKHFLKKAIDADISLTQLVFDLLVEKLGEPEGEG